VVLKGRNIKVQLEDGDRLSGIHLEGTSDLVIYLFHGLLQDISASYIQRVSSLLSQQGHSVFLVNQRGCGTGLDLAKEIYHAGRASDLSRAIEYGRNLYPHKKHIAIGFSASGNALLLLLSKMKNLVGPDAAVSVNAPIDLEAASNHLRGGLSRIYDFNLMLACRRVLKQRSVAGLNPAEFKVPLWWTIRDFDEEFTAIQGGFRDRNDYYTSCSSQNFLHQIGVPALLIAAEDDPFIPYESYLNSSFSSSVHLHVERTGGHLGFLTAEKTRYGTNRWLDEAICKAVSQLEKVFISNPKNRKGEI
jgi:uncharacterized protein